MIGLEIRGAVFANDRPFGGISVVLVGDFDQKLPVQRRGSLAQVLVNSVTDGVRYMSAKEVLQRHAADVFGSFTKYTTFTTTLKVCSRVYTFYDRKGCGNRVRAYHQPSDQERTGKAEGNSGSPTVCFGSSMKPFRFGSLVCRRSC